jgi:hypothetical protein
MTAIAATATASSGPTWRRHLHHVGLYVYICYQGLGVEHHGADGVAPRHMHLRQV